MRNAKELTSSGGSYLCLQAKFLEWASAMGKSKGGKDKPGTKGAAEKGSKGKSGKGKKGGESSASKTCNFVKARHILCEKQGKASDAYRELCEGWLDDGNKVPPGKFGEIAKRYSECSSSKSGGNLGWFPRGKMEGKFQDIAFNTAPGQCSQIFKGANGYHIILVEGRRA